MQDIRQCLSTAEEERSYRVVMYVMSDLRNCSRLEIEDASARELLVNAVQLRSHQEVAVLHRSFIESIQAMHSSGSTHLGVSMDVLERWMIALGIRLEVLLEVALPQGEELLKQDSLLYGEMSSRPALDQVAHQW